MSASGPSQRQAEYLQAMGIQTWVRKTPLVAETVAEPSLATAPESAPLPVPDSGSESASPTPQSAPQPATEAARSAVHAPVVSGTAIPGRDVSRLGWPQLRSAVASCTACVLHESRSQTVFGVGDQQAQWLIIGEAPGTDEDQQGEPFVGRAGKLLTNMLQAAGLKREQAYITNILKCHPPDNRDPRPDEIAQCEGFLRRQVELIQPKVILAVGRIAAHSLLQSKDPLGRLRGKLHHYRHNKGETPVVVTYHPAYLLRTPRDKAKAWEDLRLALKVVQEETVP